jgi:hypothetical protein
MSRVHRKYGRREPLTLRQIAVAEARQAQRIAEERSEQLRQSLAEGTHPMIKSIVWTPAEED